MDYLGIVAPYQRGVEESATLLPRFGPRADCDRFDWLLSWARETDLRVGVGFSWLFDRRYPTSCVDSHCSDRTNCTLLKLKEEFDQVRAYKATHQ
jgi:hypothetical protein